MAHSLVTSVSMETSTDDHLSARDLCSVMTLFVPSLTLSISRRWPGTARGGARQNVEVRFQISPHHLPTAGKWPIADLHWEPFLSYFQVVYWWLPASQKEVWEEQRHSVWHPETSKQRFPQWWVNSYTVLESVVWNWSNSVTFYLRQARWHEGVSDFIASIQPWDHQCWE